MSCSEILVLLHRKEKKEEEFIETWACNCAKYAQDLEEICEPI